MTKKAAITAINKNGVLLVFPIKNAKEPKSLWSEFFPRSKMSWEWDEDGDNRVAGMWRLMKDLSDCGEVVYSKWYQGRATFFSKEVFTALLKNSFAKQTPLSLTSQKILEILRMDSPLSTKEIKKMTELQGKLNEATYNRAMKELFSRFLVVAYGEVDDGAFPSLAVGSTKLLFEDLFEEAEKMSPEKAHTIIEKYMPRGSQMRKYLSKIES